MGRLIEQLAPEYGFDRRAQARRVQQRRTTRASPRRTFAGIDVAIEFSIPAAVPRTSRGMAALGVQRRWSAPPAGSSISIAVRAAVEQNGTGLVWSPNYSIGVNVFFRLVAEAARLLAARAGVRRLGLGDPSLDQEGRAVGHAAEAGGGDEDGRLRAPDRCRARTAPARIPGTHEIGFDSAADTITLRHTARSREGFARGALQAAQWIVGKKGFYEFSEILFRSKEEVVHVHRMRHRAGDSVPARSVAG